MRLTRSFQDAPDVLGRSYLTVHEVRFFWRRDIGKKTKIMRKVKFPFELDAIELVTDDLKRKMQPLNDRLKDVDRDRRERAKVRRRAKAAQKERARMDAQKRSDAQRGIERDPTLADEELKVSAEKATGKTIGGSAGAGADADVEMRDAGDGPRTTEGELVDEPTKRREEAEELRKLIDPAIAADQGANASGLYELAAIVTHAGASADGGHYVGWSRVPPQDTEGGIDYDDPDKQEWYRFDDDKVTVVSKDRIAALDGGGASLPLAHTSCRADWSVVSSQARRTAPTSSSIGRSRSSSLVPSRLGGETHRTPCNGASPIFAPHSPLAPRLWAHSPHWWVATRTCGTPCIRLAHASSSAVHSPSLSPAVLTLLQRRGSLPQDFAKRRRI